jgi:hypothetical protein
MWLIVGSGRVRVWAYTGTRIRFFFIPDARPDPTNRTRTYAPGRVRVRVRAPDPVAGL